MYEEFTEEFLLDGDESIEEPGADVSEDEDEDTEDESEEVGGEDEEEM